MDDPSMPGDAFAQLLAAHAGFINNRVRRVEYSNYGLDLADLRQHAAIGLWRALRRFDATRGVKFTTFARFFVDQEIRKALRRARAFTFIEDVQPTSIACVPDPSTQIVEHLDLRRALTRLSLREQYVVMAVSGFGITQAEVAEMLHVTQQAVQKTRSAAIVKLRKHLAAA